MLTVKEHMHLEIEGRLWKYQGAKEAYVRDHLGVGITRHAQIVMRLLDSPDAEAANPRLVRRLRRLRDQRRAHRTRRVAASS